MPLKNNKAPGLDGLSGEFYKYAAPCVVEFLTQYFNFISFLIQEHSRWGCLKL